MIITLNRQIFYEFQHSNKLAHLGYRTHRLLYFYPKTELPLLVAPVASREYNIAARAASALQSIVTKVISLISQLIK